MNQLLETFLAESRDLLEIVGAKFLELESAPEDGDLLNELFRAVHTIKGSSGLFEIGPLTAVVHAAEDVLDRVRAGELLLTSNHVDLFLDAMDQVNSWLDDLESTEKLGESAQGISENHSSRLRALLPEHNSPADSQHSTTPVEAQQEPSQSAAPEISWLAEVPESLRAELAQAQTPCVAIVFTPDEQAFFQGHDPVYMVRNLPGLAWFRVYNREPWSSLETFDPYTCILAFQILSTASLEEILEYLRYVTDQIQVSPLPAEALVPGPTPGEAAAPVAAITESSEEQPLQPEIIEILTAQLGLLELVWDDELAPGRLESVATILQRILPQINQPAARRAHAGISSARDEAFRLQSGAPLAALIESVLSGEPAAVEEQEQLAEPVVAAEAEQFPLEQQQAGPVANGNEEKQKARILKVDQYRIDALMDLVGELVVAKNALPFLAKRAEEVFKVRELAREIKSHYAIINRLAEDMQYAVMQVRMVPVGNAFGRFPRLVRDLSRKLGKKVQLVVLGEETEADKNVVEDLADPLIHLVRNSLDHGIETPEKREAAGKDPRAQLTLRAVQQDDRVIIEIVDDGAGIDPAYIREKAFSKGLISEEERESISDQDALQLIFVAGFSTTQTISDVSGRGVGMDVVRSAVQKAGGDVALESTIGVGTTVRLSLPLSMALTQVMMIRVAGEDYGIPFEAVKETVRIRVDSVHRIKQKEAVIHRDRLLPLHRLTSLLNLHKPVVEEESNHQDELAVLVVRSASCEVGLIVDAFHEAIDIILKPMDGVMSGFPLYSGTALLGDGRVLLVLNLRELLRCQ